MRPLAIEPVVPAPAALLGLCVIRGANVPVLDASWLLAGRPGAATRLVVLRVRERSVALAVAAVVGVRVLAPAELQRLPPLLDGAGELLQALGVLDGALLVVLRGARLLELLAPPDVEAKAP